MSSGPPDLSTAIPSPKQVTVNLKAQVARLERELEEARKDAVSGPTIAALQEVVARVEREAERAKEVASVAAVAPAPVVDSGADRRLAQVQGELADALADLRGLSVLVEEVRKAAGEEKRAAAAAVSPSPSPSPSPASSGASAADVEAAVAVAVAKAKEEAAGERREAEKRLRAEHAKELAAAEAKASAAAAAAAATPPPPSSSPEDTAKIASLESENAKLQKKLDVLARQFDMVQEQVAKQLGVASSANEGGRGVFGTKSIRSRNKFKKKEAKAGGAGPLAISSPGRAESGAKAGGKGTSSASTAASTPASTPAAASSSGGGEQAKAPVDAAVAAAATAKLQQPLEKEKPALKPMPKMKIKEAIARLADNDPELELIDFSGKSTFSNEHAVNMAAALHNNTHCREIHLRNCSIITTGGKAFGEMLAVNRTLQVLNLEKNKIKTDGIETIGKGLAKNTTLVELNLFQNAEPGTAACEAFIKSLETNMTLLKVNWRITSRQSFAINKGITRNNEILRRRREGKPFDDLLPWSGGEKQEK
jgi:hypothetical protein